LRLLNAFAVVRLTLLGAADEAAAPMRGGWIGRSHRGKEVLSWCQWEQIGPQFVYGEQTEMAASNDQFMENTSTTSTVFERS
jgi:hypothetical protein